MGDVVGAALVSHVPPIVLSEADRRELDNGENLGTQFHLEGNAAHIDAWLESATDAYLAEWDVDRASVRAEIRAHETRNVAQCERFVDWALSLR